MYIPRSERLRDLAVAVGTEHSLSSTDADWESRQPPTPPGIVWSVESDTCLSGPPAAPQNITWGRFGEEFVFRQPRDEPELNAVLSAAVQETFDCYRFDGLSRWTLDTAQSWFETIPSLKSAIETTIRTHRDPDPEWALGLHTYLEYLASDELRVYREALLRHLASKRTV